MRSCWLYEFTVDVTTRSSARNSYRSRAKRAAGIIPVVRALLGKGAALGTVLAFMMAVIGLSAPEAVILRKVLTWPLIFTFFGVVAVGIMLVGFLFNFIM